MWRDRIDGQGYQYTRYNDCKIRCAHPWLLYPYPLPTPLLEKADEVFDLPGFASGEEAQEISFKKLLPPEFAPK